MPEPAPSTGLTKSTVNLREGPGTNFPVKTLLPVRKPVLILGAEGDWFKVKVNDQEGFIRTDLVLLPSQQIMHGFLIHQPEASEWVLAPAVTLAAPSGAGPRARMAANIWNKYGGLLETLAAKISIHAGVAVAVVAAESGGSGFSKGRMIIRFENHYFWRLWGKQNAGSFNSHFRFNQEKTWTGHEFRPGPNKPWQNVHVNQDSEWMVFDKASALNEVAAKRSISMGLPQIMGDNHSAIGYDSVQEMFAAFNTDERAQLTGLFDFIQGPHSVSEKVIALQNRDFEAFASKYNGPGKAAEYGAIIAGFFEAYGTLQPA